jgi:hypothetical protein
MAVPWWQHVVPSAHAAAGAVFVVGVNYPWIAYGHDCGSNAWGRDGFITNGWTYQTYVDSQGFTDSRRCTEKAHTGGASLCVTADLIGQDPHRSRAEVYMDLRSHRPPGVAVPVNLAGRTVRCWVYLPPESAGAWPSAPNGVQFLCKSEGWWSWYSQWQNIRPEWEGTWVELSANLSDPPGYQDSQFDPTKVIALGLKAAINDASTAILQGRIYLDDYVLGTDPPISFDFEQFEVERDFLILHQVLARCTIPVVRVFILADGRAAPEFAPGGEVTGFDPSFFEDFDVLITAAQQHQLLLLPVLLDFSWCNKPKSEGGAQLGGHSDIIRDPAKQQTFVDLALIPLLERYRDHPHILGWDIINEPEWRMQGVGGPSDEGDPVTVEEMQAFVRRCAEVIHAHTSHLVTVGSARRKWLEYWRGIGLDFYQFHWYDHFASEEPFPWPPYAELGLDRPCIIGEVPTATTNYSTAQYVKAACRGGYHGVLVWSYRPYDELSSFAQAQGYLKRWCTFEPLLIRWCKQ